MCPIFAFSSHVVQEYLKPSVFDVKISQNEVSHQRTIFTHVYLQISIVNEDRLSSHWDLDSEVTQALASKNRELPDEYQRNPNGDREIQ